MAGFTSQLYPGEKIIHDGTPTAETHDPAFGRGLIEAVGYAGTAADPFPRELLIPRSEWQARIQEMEETGTNLSSMILRENLPEKDQNGLPYCWIFGPTQCVEVVRMLQHQPYVSLSPASAGGPIKNFQAEGGWGKEGLQYIVDHGLVPSAKWPDCSLDRRLWTEENKQLALSFCVTEWWELRSRDDDEMFSLLLRRVPGAAGLNWWSHEVMYCDAVWLDGAPAVRFRNQWQGYGNKNFSILQGSRMRADDFVAPRVATAA